MEFSEIMNLIASNGFSVVAAVGVFYAYYTTTKESRERTERINQQHTEQIERMNTQHMEEIKLLTSQLQANTAMLETVARQLERIDGKLQ